MKHLWKIFFGVGVLTLVFYAARDGVRYWRAYTTQDALPTATLTPSPTPRPLSETLIAPSPVGNGRILVSAPQRDTTASLPFIVTGRARVFEGAVRISLKDPSGGILYDGFTTAGEAGADGFGSFTHTVSHLQKPIEPGPAILDVFWDSPENGKPLDTVTIPLTFSTSGARVEKIYFSNRSRNPSSECESVLPVERLLAHTQARASEVLKLLFEGPTPDEQAQGYVSEIPQGIAMPRLVVAQGRATLTFAEDVFGGDEISCRAKTLRAQVEQTLYKIPGVSGVVIQHEL